VEDEKIQEIKRNIKKRSHLDFQKMIKAYCGTKKRSVWLMSRS
jgi:hypothetical protein